MHASKHGCRESTKGDGTVQQGLPVTPVTVDEGVFSRAAVDSLQRGELGTGVFHQLHFIDYPGAEFPVFGVPADFKGKPVVTGNEVAGRGDNVWPQQQFAKEDLVVARVILHGPGEELPLPWLRYQGHFATLLPPHILQSQQVIDSAALDITVAYQAPADRLQLGQLFQGAPVVFPPAG